MSDGFQTLLNEPQLLARLSEISRRFDDLSPAMLAIGEVLTESTKVRFQTSSGPDGKAWAPNKVSTVLARISQIKGAYQKDGRLSKKGAGAFIAKKPLVDTGLLADTINYQLINGGNGVEIGTNRFAGEWTGGAAVHQFGNKKGTIPARPFLGISDSDRDDVLDILSRFAQSAIS